MFKFLFDEQKKEKFLHFWNLSTLEDFSSLAEDPFLFSLHYSRLAKEDKCLLAHLIAFYEQTQTSKINPLPVEESASPQQRNYPKKVEKTEPPKDPSPQLMSVKMLIGKTQYSATLGEEIIEKLHNLHLINWLKNRSNLSETHDCVELTEEMKSFLKKSYFLSNDKNIRSFTKEPAPQYQQVEPSAKNFSQQEWDILTQLSFSYAVPVTFIAKKDALSPIIQKAFTAKMLFLGIREETGELYTIFTQFKKPLTKDALKVASKAKSPTLAMPSTESYAQTLIPLDPKQTQRTKKKLVEKLFAITAFLYELKTRESSIQKHLAIKNETEIKQLFAIAKIILKKERWKALLKSSLYNKLYRIFYLVAPQSILFLTDIEQVFQESFKKIDDRREQNSPADSSLFILKIEKNKLLLVLNQKRFWHGQAHIRAPQLDHTLKTLQAWQILSVHQTDIHLNISLIALILHPKRFMSLTDLPHHDQVILDSDMTMTVFNETGSLATLHFLSLFTKITFSDHVTQCTPELEFSHLSWFSGLNHKNTLPRLEKLTGATFNQQAKEYFHLYFQHITLAKVSRALLLQASSKQIFLKMKYALKEHGTLNDEVLFIEDEAILVFNKKQSYLAAKEILANVTKIF